MTTPQHHGLFTATEQAVPLEGVRIEARLAGPCFEVTVTQRYRNRETVPVEAVYVFPLEEGAAVCGFAAVVGDRLVRGHVEERERAFERYDDAMMEGHGAFLLDQERPNVFTASVGNLRPKETVELQIRYVALARREGDALRIGIPTTVSPRYVPAGPPEVGQPDAERVNPEHWLRVPYGLTLRVDVEAGSALRRVESPSHPVRMSLRDGGATVELAQDEPALDRDFVLLVEAAEPHRPFAMVAREDDGRRVALLCFAPDLAPSAGGHEVVFLLDCSGSMQGESIAQAKRALMLCIRALREGDTFNVVRFGDRHDALWPAPRRFEQGSLDEATAWLERIGADLGGTEIHGALWNVLQHPRDAERPRRVLLLTDGQVSNEQDVIDLARKHADHARVFTFGIGAGASEHLVRGVARASRAAAEMIFPGERIEPKVLRMFDRVRTPILDDVRVDWQGLQVEQAPGRTPPVFAGDHLVVLGRIEGGAATEVALMAGERRWGVAIDMERAAAGGPIPILWARERIRELDDEREPRRGSQQRRPEADDARRRKLVELGTRYGLLSSATSYVAIEERAPSERTDRPAELRRIPVALTTGWGGVGLRGGVGPGGQHVNKTMAVGRAALTGSAGGMPFPPPAMSAPRPSPAAYGAPPMRPAAPAPMAARAVPASVLGQGRGEAADGFAPTGYAAPQASPAAVDHLFEVLMTQRADGSFPRSRDLATWLGAERTRRLDEAIAAAGEAVAVTAVVVALLEREHRAREAEWRPAVAKARQWLAAGGATFDATSILA